MMEPGTPGFGGGGSSYPPPLQPLEVHITKWRRKYQQTLDKLTPHTYQRWAATAGLITLFVLRIVFSQGWYIVCYAHAIYLLNLLLAFLQPKFDPSIQDDIMADDMEEGGDVPTPLPSSRDDEFRPFVRRLPEWQFWLSTTRATIIAIFCTLSTIFDVPVYWPILVMYFFVLLFLTMRRQIQHMIKYKYVPFDIGRKARYGSVTQTLMNFFWDCPGTERERLALAEPYASRSLMSTLPLVPPLFPAGKEPLPPGFTEDDRQVMLQNKRMQNYMQMGMESCLAKTTMAAGMGFGMGAFISLMSSSFAYEDPLIRQQQQAIGAISTTAKAREIFAEMGRGMWRSGKGFAKVTVLFAGTECVIESYRARNDIGNAVAAGFIAGGVLARNTGPRGALWGGLGFAAFSAAIDLFLRRETPEED